MTERERLIELVKQSLIKHIDKTCKLAENITEDLLANGVIVPPCKVGQTVYVPDNKSVQEYTVHAVECDEKHLTIKCHSWLAEREGLLHKHTAYFDLDDFGKTVFLTREEAEKELEERGKS